MITPRLHAGLAAALALLLSNTTMAETYRVGPSGSYRQLTALPTLNPGDVVEVEGGADYEPVWFRDDGAPGNPIVIRGIRSASGARPVIRGGANTIQLQGDHYVLEGFDITGGTSRCVYHHADDIVIRDVVIHDCPAHGLLGADNDSGSLLLEYSEVYACGEGGRRHQIYMSTDQIAHPGSVFRMQFCYVHDGNGGNGVKSRAERNEIYYNWIENSYYHELELIGPDPGGTSVAEGANQENSDVVGNVFVKGGLNPDGYVLRFGGDGTGQTNGRYRFVYNTVVLAPGSSGVFRLFDGIESLEAHNNVFFQTGTGSTQIVRDRDASWVGGTRRVAGSNNWLITGTGARDIPAEWTGTIEGADPMFEAASSFDFRPASGSPLIDAANPSPSPVAGYGFPGALPLPLFQPPQRSLLAAGDAVPRPMAGAGLDVGAFEFGSGPPIVTPDAGVGSPDAGARDGGARDGGACTPSCGTRECGDDGCGGLCGSCAAGLRCSGAGACECTLTSCGGACVDTASSPDHCGACDQACAASEVCSGGSCGAECAGGLSACARSCVDTTADRLNCGACGNVCGDEEACVSSTCQGSSPASGGCGCRISGGHRQGALPLLGLALAWLLLRRRGRCATHGHR